MIGDLPDILSRRAELSGRSPALEEPATGRVLDYAVLDERAGRAAALLRDRGLGEGDTGHAQNSRYRGDKLLHDHSPPNRVDVATKSQPYPLDR